MNLSKYRFIGLILCLVLVASFLIACDKQPVREPSSSPAPQETPVPDTEANRKMDMIMWYDCDGWVSSMTLNPDHPNKPTSSCRVADTYFGSYTKITPEIALQHAYWISSVGCNVICCDWTNYISFRQKGNNFSYNRRIYNNTEELLTTLKEVNTFDAPSLYVAIRLSNHKYEDLEMILDDVYALYEENKEKWYYFDDGSENADKPFIVIFTDVFFNGEKWYDRAKNAWFEDLTFYEDDRFNIRWSNGYLEVVTEKDENGWFKIPGERPYWTFVEPYLDEKAGEGLYEVMYSAGLNGQIEQMSCWASMFAENKYWDPLNNQINDQTTFERTLRGVKELSPKALLVNRFNYPLAWPEEPQEGLSITESTHIEPNKDLGFSVFDNVKKNLYLLNNWTMKAPSAPECLLPGDSSESILTALKNGSQVIKLSLEGKPQEYRVSSDPEMSGAEYQFYNLTSGIVLTETLKNGDGPIYIQTRNAFGESPITKIE